jgi:hypothetical protein
VEITTTDFSSDHFPLLKGCADDNRMPLRDLEAACVRWARVDQSDREAETTYLGALVVCESWLLANGDAIRSRFPQQHEALEAEITSLLRFLAQATQEVVNTFWRDDVKGVGTLFGADD